MLTRFFKLLILAMALSYGVAVSAQDGAKPFITKTIQSQIDAFLKDDFDQAFSYASPFIQEMFGTPQRFGMMVSRGYPMVHRPKDVQYLELRQAENALYQKVKVRDAQGRVHFLEYQMIQGEKGWVINGVQLLKASGLST